VSPEAQHPAPRPRSARAAAVLEQSESVVLVLVGAALVVVAGLLLIASMSDLWEALRQGTHVFERRAIDILNTVLLVMMTMEIMYTVAISLESHTLDAEPFLIIGTIASIRRMLVITATSAESETDVGRFHNTLVELGLLAGTVIVLAAAIWILRHSEHRYVTSREERERPPE
jgi:phosphate starvation-inducible membrane PsiE